MFLVLGFFFYLYFGAFVGHLGRFSSQRESKATVKFPKSRKVDMKHSNVNIIETNGRTLLGCYKSLKTNSFNIPENQIDVPTTSAISLHPCTFCWFLGP